MLPLAISYLLADASLGTIHVARPMSTGITNLRIDVYLVIRRKAARLTGIEARRGNKAGSGEVAHFMFTESHARAMVVCPIVLHLDRYQN